MFYILLLSLGWGAPPTGTDSIFSMEPDESIVVTATRQTEVYVAPTKIVTNGKGSFDLDKDAVFAYANVHKGMAKYKGDYGYYSMKDQIDVYSSETIDFLYEDCAWDRLPKKCAMQNDMWLLESSITFGKEHITVRMILYDENMLVLNQSVISKKREIKYVERQKKTKTPVTQAPITVRGGRNCSGTSCSPGGGSVAFQQPRTSMQTTVEDLPPTKIVINPRLLDRDIHQASMLLWVDIKVD